VTRDTISKFNRETVWLATGVLGTVVFAALVLAVQEWQPKATQTERGLLLNASPATVASVIAKSSNSNGKMTPGRGSSVDHTLTETSLQEIPSAQTEPAASTPVLALAPEINSNDAQANPGPGTLAQGRQDSARAIGPKARNARDRSSVASRSLDVKRRLIELWHQSLAKTEKSRSWTAFSNLNRGERKKAAYTAETNH
jgi:hypothetical protein